MKTGLTIVVCALLLASCSQPPLAHQRLTALSDRLQQHFTQGETQLRNNPVECTCPPFEVLVGNHWYRVELVDSSHPDWTLQGVFDLFKERLEQEDYRPISLPLELETSKWFFCGNGTPYFRVAIRSPGD